MLPEAAVGGMQEPCTERKCEAASPPLEGPPEPPSPPHWTPEHFLQSTLHEGKGVVCLTPGDRNGNGEEADSRDKQSGEPSSKPARGRRKQQWKLKFHHQALPPEYLDHYEASLSKARPMAAPPPHTTSSAAQTDLTPPPFYDINNLPSESIQNWLQRITSIQNDLDRVSTPTVTTPPTSAPTRRRRAPPVQTETSSFPIAPKVVNYRDLPYMGEMTLNNSKPRRGRKPKKADICHLIYKNYGTIFPGTPGHLVDERLNGTAGVFDKNIQIKREKGEKIETFVAPNKQKTDLQNKIISSLLEKRLSQESKKHKEVKVKKQRNVHVETEEDIPNTSLRLQTSPPFTPATSVPSPSISEPLNLCVRDLNNLKIRLLRKHGNVYAKASVEPKIEPSESETGGDDKTPTDQLPSTSAPDSVSPTPRMNILDFKKALQEATSSGDSDISTVGKTDIGAESPLPGGYVYWPNAGVFVHPLALQSQLLYYQGLAAGNSYTLPPDTGSPESPVSVKLDRSTPLPIDLEQRSSPGGSSGCSTPRLKRGTSVNRGGSMAAPTKRKRSAIFIPPMPSETGSSPATEVSICKFKFTGGARPSLQEKKMLSVDSGGNFRYYSGTGDKANRGYEFFPRESLQQSVGAGAGGGAGGAPPLPAPAHPSEDPARKKRKSRKSIQREKLEQTFKEKGFLIQTQQLESAEGATYCKFRQLRKFTRYLFRSWKDYLPGAIQDSEGAPGSVPVQPLPPPPPGHADWP